MSQPFVHLHLHSEFSLSDGIVRLKPLAEKCEEMEQPAVALTDWCNLYGAVKFYKACLAKGVKPIIGSDIWVESSGNKEVLDRITLLCVDNAGYKNLSRMITAAHLRGNVKGKIIVSWEDLEKFSAGLICLLDEQEGPVANLINQDAMQEAMQLTIVYQHVFKDRIYLAISRIGWSAEEQYIAFTVGLASRLQIGLVARNRVEFIKAEEFEAHEIRVCINDSRVLEDSRRPRKFTDQQYLRSADEMQALFADIPNAISNTIEIARRCNLFFNFDEDFLPDFPETNGRSEAELLRAQSQSGLARRLNVESLYKSDGSANVDQPYIDRLNLELGVIEQMGFPGYFLIVADFIRWSRENDIPVGPGRGSGAGSLVAWSTGITELDPLPFGLLFERFLNPERVSLPDFDIDFCVDGRDKVIDYVAERYGQDQVAQIITFGTMAAKAVIRDVGRVMSFSYSFVDQIAKLIPFEVGMTLQKAMDQEQVLVERYEEEADVKELIDAALQLEGIARNVGKHAGGVVISPKPLTEYTPLYADSHLAQAITQLDKDDLEAIGLVKFDFLGLRTLTILDSAVKLVNKFKAANDQPLLNLDDVPLDDQPTYQFVQSGKTTAMFQLESRGMKELILRMHPENFDDLIALIALFRPGPLQSGMVDDFVNRKSGKERVKYLHPELEPILNTTYGVILYQEQVMEIARSLAGYTLGGADFLRKAMGKKLPAEMAKQREKFMHGSSQRGIDKKIAESIFDLMDKFAGYGFNKSHSAAYALISYHTAWMKTHYTSAYMAATLSSDMDSTDKVVTLLADCKMLELEVLPPKIDSSVYTFMPIDEKRISYGLGALKGVGQGVVENIVEERDSNGPYADLYEFCRRLDTGKVNKRVLEALIKSGAMDPLGDNRAVLMAEVGNALKAAGQQQQNENSGQGDLFGPVITSTEKPEAIDLPDWADEQRLAWEKSTLGLYLTGHPYDRYANQLDGIYEADVSNLDLTTPRNGIFAGIIVGQRVINTRRGKMGVVTLDNGIHRVEATLFSEKYNEYYDRLQTDNVLIALGELSADDFTGGCQVRVEILLDMDELRAKSLRGIELNLQESTLDGASIASLQALFSQHRGGKAAISIRYTRRDGETGLLNLGDDWKVKPDAQLIEALEAQFGCENINYYYNKDVLYNAIPQKNYHRQKMAVNH